MAAKVPTDATEVAPGEFDEERIVMDCLPWFFLFFLAACSSLGTKPDSTHEGKLMPPVAEKQAKSTMMHGDERVDDYHWLQQKDDPKVHAYLKAENAYADAMMKPTEALREKLFAEIKGRIKQTEESVPVRDHGYWYYTRIEDGKQYRELYRKKGDLESPEQVLLDLNELAKGHKYLSLGTYEVSDDGMQLAYSLDTTGFREYTLYVKDLGSGSLRAERIEKVKHFAWADDDKTLFYTLDDHAKRSYRLYRHRIGEKDDVLVYEEKDERFSLRVSRSRDRRWLMLGSDSLTTSEVRLLSADHPQGDWQVVAPRIQDQEYSLESVGDAFYILTNDRGRNFRVVKAPADDPGRENWTEFLAHDSEIMRKGFGVFRGKYVSYERQGGLPHLRVGDLESGASTRISLPESAYTVYPHWNPESDSGSYRYVYQSLTTPRSLFELDLETLSSKLLKEREVLGGYDRNDYKTERLEAISADGTRVPISLVYKKGAREKGPAPLFLTGYGSYGSSMPISFSYGRISLLDRGMIIAIAHIRGGGEMGKAWHDSGRMKNKPNTFSDFVTVAEYLIGQGYTASDRLAISGASAGGLLMGAALNMRPELFHAAVLEMPFVDVLNTMLNKELPLTVVEYEEWGNPMIEDQYRRIKSYCPYTNLAAKDYPAMLVRTSLDDSQVMYWEPAKYVAKLRALKTNDEPLVFHTNMDGGHGGSSGRYKRYREQAYAHSFILWQLGIRQ